LNTVTQVPSITPCLELDQQAEPATKVEFGLFPDACVLQVARWPATARRRRPCADGAFPARAAEVHRAQRRAARWLGYGRRSAASTRT
jgi:hypothetical protein